MSRTKSGSLSFSGCNLQLERTLTNHIYSCPGWSCVSVTQSGKQDCIPYTSSLSCNKIVALFVSLQDKTATSIKANHGNSKQSEYAMSDNFTKPTLCGNSFQNLKKPAETNLLICRERNEIECTYTPDNSHF